MDSAQPGESTERTWQRLQALWRTVVNEEIVKDLPSNSEEEDSRADEPLVCSDSGQDGLLLLEKSVGIGGVVINEITDLGHDDRRLDGSRHVDDLNVRRPDDKEEKDSDGVRRSRTVRIWGQGKIISSSLSLWAE